MARVKRDNTSWKASGIERRDFRAQHGPPEVMPGPPRHKDRKRWCRGREGREHHYEWVRDKRFRSDFLHAKVWTLKCSGCGREEATCYPRWNFRKNCDCPRHN